MTTMTATQKIPATVVTGFLGAGKTTLIRHLLANARGRRLALIVNEFGDIGVDGEVLKACGNEACTEDDIVELANGCICCTVADDFLPTMRALLDRPNPPEHIVIETSGLALPKPLVRAFGWPEIRTRVTVDGVVTVIDGRAVADGLFAPDPAAVMAARAADPALDHASPLEEVFGDQLASADLVVVNKADLLGDGDDALVEARMRASLRPLAKVVRTRHGAVAPAVLLGLAAAAEDDLATRPSCHDAEDEHEHDDFESLAVTLGPIASPAALMARLRPIVADAGVLRVKGFAAVAGRDMRLVLQGVGGRLHHYYDRDWRPDEARLTRLVFIGLRGLDRAAIAGAMGA